MLGAAHSYQHAEHSSVLYLFHRGLGLGGVLAPEYGGQVKAREDEVAELL